MTDLGVKDTVARLMGLLERHGALVSLVVTADLVAARQRPGTGGVGDGILAFAKRARRGMILSPEWNDGDLFGITVPTKTVEPLTGTGRGLWCENGDLRVAQLVAAPALQTAGAAVGS